MKRLLLCVLLVGCGGDDGGGGGNGTVELDNLGAELGTASCAKQFECCTDAEIMMQFMNLTFEGQPITTEQQCADFTNAFFTAFAVTSYKESIALGRAEYDGAAAASCIAALYEVTCAELATGDIAAAAPGCRPFIVPKVADGGGCTQDYECTSDNCVGETNDLDGPDTDGSCEPLPGDGQPCDDNCTEGFYCDYSQTANDDVCVPRKVDGVECVFDDECASDFCDDATDQCASEPTTCDGR